MTGLIDCQYTLSAVGGEKPHSPLVPGVEFADQTGLAINDLGFINNPIATPLGQPNCRAKPMNQLLSPAQVVVVNTRFDLALDRWHPFTRKLAFREQPFTVAAVASLAIFTKDFVELHVIFPFW